MRALNGPIPFGFLILIGESSSTVRLFSHLRLFHVKHAVSGCLFHVERSTIYAVPRETSCLSPNLSATFTPLLGEFHLARVIAITNQKGGVGKTTTAVNLGASLAASEQRTLIIDCDPQGNTTSALGFPKDPARRTLYQALILEESIDRIILDAQVEGLDLIPSDKNLVGAAVELVNMENREYRLRALVASLQARYNYVLIDCPPSLDLLTLNALAAADSVLVPIQCEYLALEGVSELLDTLMRLRRTINPSLAIEGILLTMYDDRTTLSKQVAADLRSFFGAQVFETVIPRNVRLAEAPSHGMPVMFYDIHSKGAESYIQLAKEVIANAQKRVGQGIERADQGAGADRGGTSASAAAAGAGSSGTASAPDGSGGGNDGGGDSSGSGAV
jgi:chromosome partitioning protein